MGGGHARRRPCAHTHQELEVGAGMSGRRVTWGRAQECVCAFVFSDRQTSPAAAHPDLAPLISLPVRSPPSSPATAPAAHLHLTDPTRRRPPAPARPLPPPPPRPPISTASTRPTPRPVSARAASSWSACPRPTQQPWRIGFSPWNPALRSATAQGPCWRRRSGWPCLGGRALEMASHPHSRSPPSPPGQPR